MVLESPSQAWASSHETAPASPSRLTTTVRTAFDGNWPTGLGGSPHAERTRFALDGGEGGFKGSSRYWRSPVIPFCVAGDTFSAASMFAGDTFSGASIIAGDTFSGWSPGIGSRLAAIARSMLS